MKTFHFIYSLLLSLAALPAMAQTMPFVEEGKTWTMEYFDGPFVNRRSTIEKLTIEGDTVIAGRKWKKVYCTENAHRQLATALYEKDGKVYYLPYAGDIEGKLLFDFNMKTGNKNTFYMPDCSKYLRENNAGFCDYEIEIEVTGMGKRSFGGAELTCYATIAEESGHDEVDFIEGVGNIYNPLNYRIVPGGPTYHLLECSVNDKTLYKTSDRLGYGWFVEEGKTWRVERRRKYDIENKTDAPSTFEQYVLEGDTLIGHTTYTKLYSVKEGNGQKLLQSVLRQDEFGITYFLPYAGATQEKVLYDFTANVGAGSQNTHYQMNSNGGWPASKAEDEDKYVTFNIQDTHLTESNGYYLSIFNTTEAADAQRKYTYLESIGSLTDPFRYTDEDYVSHVVECSVGGKVIYSEPVWKKPTTGIENLRDNESRAKENALYDLSGRRIYQTPKHGVYIRNGRKFIVK